jgi:D-alanyl-D-alanine carboxypeptidase
MNDGTKSMESIKRKLFLAVNIFLIAFVTNTFSAPKYSSIVIEYPSQKVLYSENPTLLNQPASLAKVMTLYLVFEAIQAGRLQLNQPLYVSAKAANRQPSKLGLKAHQTITVQDVICGLVTKSANDAASVIAENLAGSEENFGHIMTEKARQLGMNNTNFTNASGIPDPKQLTNATDMAILGFAILRDFPGFYKYFSLREFEFQGRVFRNHNHLLGKYPGTDGIKTGFTVASGFNLISSAQRNGHRLIGVILGGRTIKSRDQRMMQILDIAFTKCGEGPLPIKADPPPFNPLPEPLYNPTSQRRDNQDEIVL